MTQSTLQRRYNPDLIGLERLSNDGGIARLRNLIERHASETSSPHAQAILNDWNESLRHFWKVVPHPETAPAPKNDKPERKPRAERTVKPCPSIQPIESLHLLINQALALAAIPFVFGTTDKP